MCGGAGGVVAGEPRQSGADPHPAARASSARRNSSRPARPPCHILGLSQTVGGEVVVEECRPRGRLAWGRDGLSIRCKEVRRMRHRGLAGFVAAVALASAVTACTASGTNPAPPSARTFARDRGDPLTNRRCGADGTPAAGAGIECRVDAHAFGQLAGRRDGSLDDQSGGRLHRAAGGAGPAQVHLGPELRHDTHLWTDERRRRAVVRGHMGNARAARHRLAACEAP